MARHICKLGDSFCGMFGYDDLCAYCKRSVNLDLQRRELEIEISAANRVRAEIALREARRIEANAAAARAVGNAVTNYPGVTAAVLGGAAALFVGAAIAENRKKRNNR